MALSRFLNSVRVLDWSHGEHDHSLARQMFRELMRRRGAEESVIDKQSASLKGLARSGTNTPTAKGLVIAYHMSRENANDSWVCAAFGVFGLTPPSTRIKVAYLVSHQTSPAHLIKIASRAIRKFTTIKDPHLVYEAYTENLLVPSDAKSLEWLPDPARHASAPLHLLYHDHSAPALPSPSSFKQHHFALAATPPSSPLLAPMASTDEKQQQQKTKVVGEGFARRTGVAIRSAAGFHGKRNLRALATNPLLESEWVFMTLKISLSRLSDKIDPQAHLFISVYPTSTQTMRMACPARCPISSKSGATVCVMIAKTIPVGVILHTELCMEIPSAKGTRMVYARVGSAHMRADTGRPFFLDEFLATKGKPAIVEPSLVEESDGSACVLQFDTAVDSKVPVVNVARTITRTFEPSVFNPWLRNIRATQQLLKGVNATYPLGTPFEFGHMPETVMSTLGRLPLFFYFKNAHEITIDNDPDHCNRVCDLMFAMTAVTTGKECRELEILSRNEIPAIILMARMARQLATLLAYTPDPTGDSFSAPLAEEDLVHASMDCEELSTIMDLSIKFIRKSTDTKYASMRRILMRYTGVYTISTMRSGPARSPKKGSDSLHCQYWLVPTATLARLEKPPGKARAGLSDPSLDTILFEPLVNLNPVIFGVMADENMWSSRTSNGMLEPLLPLPSLLNPQFSFESVFTYNYQGSIVAMYVVEGPNPRQLIPLDGDGKLGVNSRAFWVRIDMENVYLLPLPFPSPAMLRASEEVRDETSNLLDFYVDAKSVELTTALADSLVRKTMGAKKAFFLLWERESGIKSLEATLKEQCEVAMRRAQSSDDRKFKEYEKLTVEVVRTSAYYLADHLEAYLVVLR